MSGVGGLLLVILLAEAKDLAEHNNPATEAKSSSQNSAACATSPDDSDYTSALQAKLYVEVEQLDTADVSFQDPHAELNGKKQSSGVSHWTLHGFGAHPDGAGASFYTRAFDLVDEDYVLGGMFQVGLGGGWILPDDNCGGTKCPIHFHKDMCPCGDKGIKSWCSDGTCEAWGGCAGIFETMEGGLGYWRTQLPSHHVKWRPNFVNGCYAVPLMTSLWTFYMDNLACDAMGWVHVSNQIIFPPDGLGFENGPDFGMMGNSFMRTTVGRTGGDPGAKGHYTYMLVLDTANFAGPVAYVLEEFWQDNMGDPDAPDFSRTKAKIGSTGFEFNGVTALTSTSSDAASTFFKTPKIKFPVGSGGKTPIMTGVRTWGNSSVQDPLEAALEGTTANLSTPLMNLAEGKTEWCPKGKSALKMGFKDLPLINIGGDMEITEVPGTSECISEIVWDESNNLCEMVDGVCKIPNLWKSEKGTTSSPQPVNSSELPSWSTLADRKFKEKTFTDMDWGHPAFTPKSSQTCVTNPGPADDKMYCVRTNAPTVVGFKWYKFVDQPALQRSALTTAQKDYLQQRIERLHDLLAPTAPINRWMEAPEVAKPLAKIDSALLVSPPQGFERGYVPIPVYEGNSETGCTFVSAPTAAPPPFTPAPTPAPPPPTPAPTPPPPPPTPAPAPTPAPPPPPAFPPGTKALDICKDSCTSKGFCCGLVSGCQRSGCRAGCYYASMEETGGGTVDSCKVKCTEKSACRWHQVKGFDDLTGSLTWVSSCGTCKRGEWDWTGGTCDGPCEPEGGCDHACETFFDAKAKGAV